ncbi:MAG TPA: amidohydrolase [Firmicutes bacterium]|nr:amidohydrolase [Candidatus Fermentithermobacillaceae bacterium]
MKINVPVLSTTHGSRIAGCQEIIFPKPQRDAGGFAMEIIDAHVHSLPRGTMDGGETDVRLETVLSGLRARNITRAIFVPINDAWWQPVDEMNDYMVEVVRKHPSIVGFIDIDISKAHLYGGIERLEKDIEMRYSSGLRGIKVHLQNLGVNADDWRLLPVYRLAGELNIPVMLHCYPGSGPGLLENSSPLYIEKMIRAFRKTHFIISHLGGIPYVDLLPHLYHDNVRFETSGVLPTLKRYLGTERLSHLLNDIGYERIFFGSDFPSCDLDTQISILKEIVPREQWNKVFSGNILEFGREFGWWVETADCENTGTIL